MKEESNHLLEKTVSLFMRYGVRSVSMDDVAREAGVSKKTLYQHYTDRSGLISSAMRHLMNMVERNCSTIFTAHENPIDQLLDIGKYFRDLSRQINPNLFFELSKYFPDAWAMINRHRSEYVEKMISENLKKGIQSGLYREEMNIEVVARIYINLIEMIMDDAVFPKVKYTFKELHHEMIIYHIHGISTPKGIKYLNEKTIRHE